MLTSASVFHSASVAGRTQQQIQPCGKPRTLAATIDTLNQKMKFKVLAYTFSVPLLWLTILLLQLIAPEFGISRSFSSAVLIGLLFGSLIGRFFLDSKYLTSLLVDDENLRLTYLTPLARHRQLTIPVDTIRNIKVKKKIFLIRDFSSIKFFSKDKQIKIYLLNNDVKQAVDQLLQTYPEKLLVSGS